MYIGTQFPQIDINWINDSSCTITFPEKEQADQAFMQFSVGRAALKINLEKQNSTAQAIADIDIGEEAKEGEQQTEEAKEQTAAQKKIDERNFDSKLGWREALSFEHHIKGWQHLWIRFATDLDVKKDETKGENSRYYKFAARNAELKKQQQSSSRHKGSRIGSHPGDRRKERREVDRVGRKQISKNEKYARSDRRRRRQNAEDSESSGFENSAEKDKDGAAKD